MNVDVNMSSSQVQELLQEANLRVKRQQFWRNRYYDSQLEKYRKLMKIMGLLRFLLFETYLINQRSPYVERR